MNEQDTAAQAKVDTARQERTARQQEADRKRDQANQKADQTKQQGAQRQQDAATQAANNEAEKKARNQKQADDQTRKSDRARQDAEQRRQDQRQREKDRADREAEGEGEGEADSNLAQTVAQAAAQGVKAALGDRDKKKEKKEHMLSFGDYIKEQPTNFAGQGTQIAGLGGDEPIVRGSAVRRQDCSKCKGAGCAMCTPMPFIRRAKGMAEDVMRELKAESIANEVMEQSGSGPGPGTGGGHGPGDSSGGGTHGQQGQNGGRVGVGFGHTHGHKCPPGKVWDGQRNKCVSAKEQSESLKETVDVLDIPAEPTTQTFAGSPVFKVCPETFAKCSGGRSKWARWSKVLNLEDEGQAAIRTYANKYPSRPIVLQCNETGDMKFLRFNRKGGGGNRKRRKHNLIVKPATDMPTPTDGGTGQIIFDDPENEQVNEASTPALRKKMLAFRAKRPKPGSSKYGSWKIAVRGWLDSQNLGQKVHFDLFDIADNEKSAVERNK